MALVKQSFNKKIGGATINDYVVENITPNEFSVDKLDFVFTDDVFTYTGVVGFNNDYSGILMSVEAVNEAGAVFEKHFSIPFKSFKAKTFVKFNNKLLAQVAGYKLLELTGDVVQLDKALFSIIELEDGFKSKLYVMESGTGWTFDPIEDSLPPTVATAQVEPIF